MCSNFCLVVVGRRRSLPVTTVSHERCRWLQTSWSLDNWRICFSRTRLVQTTFFSLIFCLGLDWYNACNNAALHAPDQRPGVDFRITLKMNLAGLIGSRQTSLSITNAGCPFELPINAP